MGILSTSTSVTQYKVKGQLEEPIIDSVTNGLKKNVITDIDGDSSEQAVGWSSFHTPYEPDFEGSSFLVGTDFLFCLRIDKKNIPPKLIKKRYLAESAKRLTVLNRKFLSKEEKRAIKESIINSLNIKIPSTPNLYDVVWQYEKGDLWFFSGLKSANEQLESVFFKSFGLLLIRKIPYTMATLDPCLDTVWIDRLHELTKTDN